MANIGQFNPGAHQPRVSMEPLPSGWYQMVIINSEVRKTKDGAGGYLWLELEIVESAHPQLKGRRVWDRLNLWNENQQAVQIAESTLTSICKAVGESRVVSETNVLHARPLAVRLRYRAETPEYEASNEVKDYDSVAARFPGGAVAASQGAAPGAAAPAATGGPVAPPANPAVPPWQQPGR